MLKNKKNFGGSAAGQIRLFLMRSTERAQAQRAKREFSASYANLLYPSQASGTSAAGCRRHPMP